MKLKEISILNVMFSLEFGALSSHLVHLYGQGCSTVGQHYIVWVTDSIIT